MVLYELRMLVLVLAMAVSVGAMYEEPLDPVGAMYEEPLDPVRDQIQIFKEKTEGPIGVLTTSSGRPVTYCEATSTFNKPLLRNELFMDVVAHLTRERIPERIVHAKGAGAFGYFESTKDISHICKADFLKKGTKTPVAMRFSTSRGFRGSNDLDLDVRGFAAKFYTREGNFDVPGFNTPIYLYKEALHSLPIFHTSRRNPATNALDVNMFWDMVTLIPESMHMLCFVFAGYGLPKSYVYMPGFGIHTYQVENKKFEQYFVRFHFMPDAGIKTLSSEEAVQRGAMDADTLTLDLYRRIANKTYPSWTVSIQILTLDDVKKEGPKIFDVTRTIPLKKYPLHKIGKIVLDRNAKNFFAEVEQMAFCPNHLVPGILGAPDKLFESRIFAYRDTQTHRLGGNFNKIPVNCPFQVETHTYNRDGVPPTGDNQRGVPNYYPNSFHGPAPVMTKQCSSLINIVETEAYNFDQAAEVYAEEFTDKQRAELIKNVVFGLSTVVEPIQFRAVRLFNKIHQDFGSRVAQGLNITMTDKIMKKH